MPRTFAERVALEQAETRRLARSSTAASRAHHTSLDDTVLAVYDRDGRLRLSYGRQPDGSFGDYVFESPAQPTPSAPRIGESDEGAAEIIWDGRTTDSSVPMVHGHVDVLAVYSPDDPAPALEIFRRVGTIRDRTGGSTVVSTPRPGRWVFRLQMIGQDGVTQGPISAPTPHVVPDSGAGRLIESHRDPRRGWKLHPSGEIEVFPSTGGDRGFYISALGRAVIGHASIEDSLTVDGQIGDSRPLDLMAGFSASRPCSYKRIGDVVMLAGGIAPSTGGGFGGQIARLPAPASPAHLTASRVDETTGQVSLIRLIVSDDGTLSAPGGEQITGASPVSIDGVFYTI